MNDDLYYTALRQANVEQDSRFSTGYVRMMRRQTALILHRENMERMREIACDEARDAVVRERAAGTLANLMEQVAELGK